LWWVARRTGTSKDEGHPVRQAGLLFASGLIAGEAIMGIVVAGLILQGPGATGIAAPLGRSMLLALTLLVFGGRLGRARALLAGLSVVAGGGVALLVAAARQPYAFRGAATWPGVLAFGYVLLLLAYVPLRESS
jgi:hypothetical protein